MEIREASFLGPLFVSFLAGLDEDPLLLISPFPGDRDSLSFSRNFLFSVFS